MVKDPDNFLKEEDSLFNLPLSNGKTLIYVACQEGKENIVNFFLQKNLNPLILSKTDFKKTENCLDVAVRWNFKKIVEILLDTKKFGVKEIKDVLSNRNLNKNIISMLKNYLGSIKSNNSTCKCF